MNKNEFQLTGEQIRAARAILRMDQKDLAKASKVSLETVKRLEKMRGGVSAYGRTLDAIKDALEGAGVEFISADNGGAGVRLKKAGGTL